MTSTHEVHGIPQHVIDLNKAPSTQEGRWVSYRHVPQGYVPWDTSQVKFFLNAQQIRGLSGIHGRSIWRQVRALPALNANALDYLIGHQHLIPEQWRRYHLFFWGTIYRESRDGEFVRCLVWDALKHVWIEIDTLVDGFGWTSRCAALLYEGLPVFYNAFECA